MCILTFLLPVIVGIAINLLSGVRLQPLNEASFGILAHELSDEMSAWLRANGRVTEYETADALWQAVCNPSTQMIGVRRAGDGIRTFRSGDELEVNRVLADTLPNLYEGRGDEMFRETNILPLSGEGDGLKSLLIVITLVTAMFMGCTFNAMNIISEKEDGVAFVNRILPMTARTYLIQKMLLGLIGGVLSAVLTAAICMRVNLTQALSLILMIVLSSLIAALTGLYIGRFSEGLMTGIVSVKAVMILFLAPPVVFWLMVPGDSALFLASYVLPSSAAFYGLMELAGGGMAAGREIGALVVHAVVWLALYLFLDGRGRRNL